LLTFVPSIRTSRNIPSKGSCTYFKEFLYRRLALIVKPLKIIGMKGAKGFFFLLCAHYSSHHFCSDASGFVFLNLPVTTKAVYCTIPHTKIHSRYTQAPFNKKYNIDFTRFAVAAIDFLKSCPAKSRS